MEDENMSPQDWINSFGNQPGPFSFLVINSFDNAVSGASQDMEVDHPI